MLQWFISDICNVFTIYVLVQLAILSTRHMQSDSDCHSLWVTQAESVEAVTALPLDLLHNAPHTYLLTNSQNPIHLRMPSIYTVRITNIRMWQTSTTSSQPLLLILSPTPGAYPCCLRRLYCASLDYSNYRRLTYLMSWRTTCHLVSPFSFCTTDMPPSRKRSRQRRNTSNSSSRRSDRARHTHISSSLLAKLVLSLIIN